MILVTGSSGFIGSHLVERLRIEGFKVIGLDYRPSIFTDIVGDVRDYDLLKGIMQNINVVVHCAAQTSVIKSVENPIFDAENNILGTLNILEAARRTNKIECFIYLSSAAVYGIPYYVPIDENHPCHPISPYGISKLAGEYYTKVYFEIYNLPTICIRLFNVYGKNQDIESPYSSVISKFINRIIKNLPLIIYGDGEQTRDFIHVNDVVDMIIKAIECKEAIGETFNCGTGKETSINELARIMMSLSGKTLEIKYSNARSSDIRRSCADIRKAEKLLGFKPKISLEKGLEELLKNYNK
ncbi:MAG: GDP-mannose 4,6-dehydratase [Candidatus Methanomethylicia archaeon]|nr:GDP-mannose 4,6-dehydratase [Candidatus Methanomethylicia archaeon]